MPATDLDLIIDTIKGAGEVALRFAGNDPKSWEKPDGAGPVTEADLAVNDFLEGTLRSARPDYGWLSEESTDTADRLTKDRVFIVDPIDGTRSFQEGSRTWAHSVAVCTDGQITAGAVYLPQRDLLYTAALGQGAFLNGEPLAVSAKQAIADAEVLATKPVLSEAHWPHGVPAFRRSHRPSLAYRLGLVGQGRFDAMLTFRPTWEWDVAAGAIIVSEAKGVCTDRKGANLRFNNASAQLDGMVASSSTLHNELMSALRP